MLKRYTIKNPNDKFSTDFYSKPEIDLIHDSIVYSAITEDYMTDTIEHFVSGQTILSRASGYTVNFVESSIIEDIVTNFTKEYVSEEDIYKKIDTATTNYVTNINAATKMNNFLYGVPTNTTVNVMMDSSITYSNEYWHPASKYFRELKTNASSYTLAGSRDSTVNMIVSGNTNWTTAISGISPWFSLSTSSGTTTTVVLITALSDNPDETIRSRTVTFSSDKVAYVPFTVTINQSVYVPH